MNTGHLRCLREAVCHKLQTLCRKLFITVAVNLQGREHEAGHGLPCPNDLDESFHPLHAELSGEGVLVRCLCVFILATH
eukprot:3954812-Amphidinium_carterae.1